MKTFTCLSCGVEKKRTAHSGKAKYCSHQCQADHRVAMRKAEFWAGVITNVDRPTLKRFIAEERGYKCEKCGISEWNDKPLSLQLSHCNGDPSDNSPKNLELICPNCHSQTDSYGGKNKGNGRKARGLPTR